MNASQKDYRALSSSLPLGDSLFSLSYSVRFVKNFFLLFSKAFRRFSTRFELFRPPPLAKQLIYITRLPHCQELFFVFLSLFWSRIRRCPALWPAVFLCFPEISAKNPPANTGGMQRLMPCLSGLLLNSLHLTLSTCIQPDLTFRNTTCGTRLPLRSFPGWSSLPETPHRGRYTRPGLTDSTPLRISCRTHQDLK